MRDQPFDEIPQRIIKWRLREYNVMSKALHAIQAAIVDIEEFGSRPYDDHGCVGLIVNILSDMEEGMEKEREVELELDKEMKANE